MKIQRWLGVHYIAGGLVCAILSTMVLAFPGLDIVTIVLMLSTTLLIFGLARIIDGVFAEYIPTRLREISGGVGILEIVVTITTMIYSQYITQTLIQLLSFVLLVHGITSALIGGFAETLPRLLRGLFMIAGLLSITLSAVAFMSIPLGFLVTVYMLAIGYLSSGIAEIILGITALKRGTRDDLSDEMKAMEQKMP